MAFDTFTLNIRETSLNGTLPSFVRVRVWPIADNVTRKPLRLVKDTTGNVVMPGHVEVMAKDGNTALVAVQLPDPRDETLNPTGFGYRVTVKSNLFDLETFFGPADVAALISGGVVEWEDVTAAPESTWDAAATYVDAGILAAGLAAEAEERAAGDESLATALGNKVNSSTYSAGMAAIRDLSDPTLAGNLDAAFGRATGARGFAGKVAARAGALAVGLAGDSTGDEGPEWFKRMWTTWLANKPWITANYYAWDDTTQAHISSVLQVGTPTPTVSRVTWDPFSRTAADVVGTPAVRNAGNWAGQAGIWSVDGSSLVAVAANQFSGPNLPGIAVAGTKRRLTFSLTLDTTSATKTLQVWLGKSGSNRVCINLASNAGTNTWKLYKQIGGTGADVTSASSVTLPSGTATTTDVTLTLDGTTLTAAMNGQSISGTLSSGDVAALSDGTNTYLNVWGAVAGTKINDVAVDVFGDEGIQTLDIYNGSRAGSTLSYQQSRVAAMFPVSLDLLMVSSSHNYTTTTVTDYLAAVEAFLDAYRTMRTGTEVVLSSQNPELPPVGTASRAAHRARLAALPRHAAARGYGYVAAAEAFTGVPNPLLIRPDGLHPTAAGNSTDGNLTDPVNGQYVWMTAALEYLKGIGAPAA